MLITQLGKKREREKSRITFYLVKKVLDDLHSYSHELIDKNTKIGKLGEEWEMRKSTNHQIKEHSTKK